MPYIKREVRFELTKRYPETSGELNYNITQEILKYMATKNLCYQTINDVMGALEGAKLEFHRRIVTPYENQKIHDNGDVYA